MNKYIKIILFIFSFTVFAMDEEPKEAKRLSELCVIFWDRISMLQANGQLIIENEIYNYSPAEIILLRISDQKQSFIAMHVDDAYETYINNNISDEQIVFELSSTQKERIINERKYYHLLSAKILQSRLKHNNYIARPGANELNEQIPSVKYFNKLFKRFLKQKGCVTKYEKYTMKKWIDFDHADTFFTKLYGNLLFSLQKPNLPGSWFIRHSASFRDDLDEHVYSRTIAYVIKSENPSRGGLRILHLLGIGFFVAQDLLDPDKWTAFPDFISLLKNYGKKTIDLDSYIWP